jgi:MFS family permease
MEDVSSKPSTITSNAPQPKVKQEEFSPGWSLYISLGTLSIIGLAASLDGTSISPALPVPISNSSPNLIAHYLKIIAAKLHGSAVEAFWAGTSFRLTATVFQPSYACFANVFGRKPMIMLAIIFFTTGSIVSAVANDFAVLLAGRTVQGMGAAGFTTMTEIIVTDLVPLRHRGLWFGIISMSVAVGSSVGPVIGGSLSEKVSWVRCVVWY